MRCVYPNNRRVDGGNHKHLTECEDWPMFIKLTLHHDHKDIYLDVYRIISFQDKDDRGVVSYDDDTDFVATVEVAEPAEKIKQIIDDLWNPDAD